MKDFEVKTDNINNIPINTGNSFTTESKELTGTIYEEITVPDDAAEVQLSSDSEFTIGESSSATGYPTDDIKLGVAETDSLWV